MAEVAGTPPAHIPHGDPLTDDASIRHLRRKANPRLLVEMPPVVQVGAGGPPGTRADPPTQGTRVVGCPTGVPVDARPRGRPTRTGGVRGWPDSHRVADGNPLQTEKPFRRWQPRRCWPIRRSPSPRRANPGPGWGPPAPLGLGSCRIHGRNAAPSRSHWLRRPHGERIGLATSRISTATPQTPQGAPGERETDDRVTKSGQSLPNAPTPIGHLRARLARPRGRHRSPPREPGQANLKAPRPPRRTAECLTRGWPAPAMR